VVAANIQITQGSGTRLATSSYTEGAVTVHDEKMLLGENYLASYISTTTVIALTTANAHLLQVMAGASLNVRIWRICIYLASPTTSTSMHQIQLWRLTTAGTGGTAFTPAKLDTGDAASGATTMILPTAKGTESTQLDTWSATVVATVAAGFSGLLFEYVQHPGMKPIIIPAGTANGIAIKGISTQATGSVFITTEFIETSF